jgi:hypothetical protein
MMQTNWVLNSSSGEGSTSKVPPEFQDGDKREEAESVLPKIKSWRDVGNTPYRKNHQEEAKL